MHLQKVEEIARNYLEGCRAVPAGFRLVISTRLERDFKVVTEAEIGLSVLRMTPKEYLEITNGRKFFRGLQIKSIFENPKISNMYQLLGMDESDILRRRNCGKKLLKALSEWLESVGLFHPMKFSQEINAEFEDLKPKTESQSQHTGLADLILGGTAEE